MFQNIQKHNLQNTSTIITTCLAVCTLALNLGCEKQTQIGPRQGQGYMINYEQSQILDYNVAWQSSVARSILGNAKSLIPGDDYIIASEDGSNVISAVTNRDGTPLWQVPVGDRLERLLGITRVGNTVIAATQSDLYLLDVATGRTTSTQKYGGENIASTMPIIIDNEAVYGTTDGRIVYHNLNAGLMRGAYRFTTGFDMKPIRVSDTAVLVVTRTGRINLLDVKASTVYWEAGVLDPIEATPALGKTGLFIAGIDQSVWAFRLEDGHLMWRTRFQYPLRDDPKLIDNILYQAVPNQGLAAINATTGQINWQNSAVKGGTVITQHNGDLIVWDKDNAQDSYGSTFYRINPETGEIKGQVRSDWINYAIATKMNNGTILGLSRAGRIIKLIP